MLLGRFLALTKTSLPKTMSKFGELVKLLSTMTSPSQVIETDANFIKSKSNRRKLASVIGTFNTAEITSAKQMMVDFVLIKLT